jgi:hypothetical protein
MKTEQQIRDELAKLQAQFDAEMKLYSSDYNVTNEHILDRLDIRINALKWVLGEM